MAKRITVIVSQSQSKSPVRREIEENLVAALMLEKGIDVTVIPNLYDLKPDGTGMLCLAGVSGDMIVCSWLFPRAAFWTLDRYAIRGQWGSSLLKAAGEDEQEEDEAEAQADGGDDKQRVADERPTPKRTIYCLDLRAYNSADPYIEEVKRIAKESATQTFNLLGWIDGQPKPEQVERYLEPTGVEADSNGTTNGHAEAGSDTNGESAAPAEVTKIDEQPGRRWYPVIDFSRCTNCMECIDFCLFGVYGVDNAETILVEQPDNCRKGCPACSRVCPENAIIFPQHKTPGIAGSSEKSASLKIDLSKLFGAPDEDPLATAVAERDEQLEIAGRDTVGMSVGIPKRQADQPQAPKDELDSLMDELDDLDL